MKKTHHFEEQLEERGIREEWCERVVASPSRVVVQGDGTTECWGFIQEASKFLKVVVRTDDGTGITVHFDRNEKRRQG